MKISEASRGNRILTWLGLLVTLFSSQIHAQENIPMSGELKGRILEAKVGVPNVHIINLSSEAATISDANGNFIIESRVGDTLLISAIRFERKSLQVSRKMLEATLLEIPLVPFVNELDEVVLWPYNLSGDLDKDLSNVPVEEPVSAISLGLPNARAKVRTQTERKLFEATTGAGLIPLNPILNAISGRTKMLKRRLARDRAYRQTLEVRSRFPDSLFVQDLGIPSIRIPDFMYYCEVDPEFNRLAMADDRLELWEFFGQKSEEYRRNNGIE